MAKNVFISFRYIDGIEYKNKLAGMFDTYFDTVDFSEDKNRSLMSEATIQNYLYGKLRRSSITIILLTPQAVNHKKNCYGKYDDWMYDEIRYSLENRENNRTNGMIAVYTPETEYMLVNRNENGSLVVRDVDNLFRKNMMNIKDIYKRNPKQGIYDRDYDSYCSLLSWREFTSDIGKYIDIASEKKYMLDRYNIIKRL